MGWLRNNWFGGEWFIKNDKVCKRAGGNQGIAGIRRWYNTRVVIWPYRLPKFFLALCFLLCSVLGVCVLLLLLIESDQRSKSAAMFWDLGFLGLGISLVSGVTRMDQVSDPRFISLVFFIFRPGQRLENLISDLKLVCVVSHRSSGFSAVWIRGVGFFWETDGIRLLKAFWVVILLKILCHRSGVLTIQVISAFCEWGLGFFVLWEGTNQGGIRMGTAVIFRTLFSALFCLLLFLVLGSSSQPCLSWLSWFLFNLFLLYSLSQLYVYIVSGGFCWGLLGGIRCSFATGVVISLNTLPFRSACFFHSLLGCYFLGNLNLVYVLVASLEGVLTILATSAVVDGNLGVLMLWGCICPGVIRKEIITVCRALISTYNIFWIFLEPYSGNQSRFLWIDWFFSKTVSCFGFESFESFMWGGVCWLCIGLGLFAGNGVWLFEREWCKGQIIHHWLQLENKCCDRFLWLWESLEEKGSYWFGQGSFGVVLGIGLLMLTGVFGLGCISSFFGLVHVDGEFFDLGLVERQYFEGGHLKDTRERVEASEDGWNEEQFIVLVLVMY
ncbi:hypothetical protein Hdeb2414_s0005g00155641 [Helianthus debilis subsp. tardiflorus]